MIDAKDLSPLELAKKQAQEEYTKERVESAKEKLKVLYRRLDSAKKICKNVENEIADLELELKDDL